MLPHGYPAAAYKKASVDTAPPVEIIVMLYRRAVLSAQLAAKAIEDKQLEKAHNNLVRSQQIIVELQASLNREAGGEIADGLLSIYTYMYGALTEANLTKNANLTRQVAAMLESLLEAWESLTPAGRGVQVGA
jgi:flagellar protein FliS